MTPRSDVPSVAIWLIALGMVAAGAFSTLSVVPRSAEAPATEFSARRAMAHVEAIAREPHPLGSAAIERVRAYIVAEVEGLGLEVDHQTVPARDFYGDGHPIEAVNVIAWIPGADHSRAVAFVGHYDTVPTTAGANDNSTAVATLLETARALRAGPPLGNDIVFLFTDGEEPSERYGSRGFAAVPGLLDALGVVVNLEAIGSGGASTLVETSGSQSWLVGGYADSVRAPAAYSFLTELTASIGAIGTDFDVFRDGGVSGMHFAYLRGSPIYHTMADDLSRVGLGSLQHHGENALAIARYFGSQDLTAVPDPGASVFFTIRPVVVRYSIVWARVVAALAIVLLAVVLVGARRRNELRLRAVAWSGAVAVLASIAGAVAGTTVWVLLTSARVSPVVAESYAYLTVLLAAGALVAGWLTARIGRHDRATSRAGAVVLWTVLTLLATIALPGFSYLFVWPALAGIAGLGWRPVDRRGSIARFALVATPILLLMTPAVDLLWQFAQPRPGNLDSQMTVAAVLPLLLGVLSITYASHGWHRRDGRDATRAMPPPGAVGLSVVP